MADATASDWGHIKGTGLMTVVRLVRERRDHVEPLLSPELRAYLDQRILVASWYPEEHFRGLQESLVHFAPKNETDPWSWIGRESAEIDLVEIYSSLVSRGNAWGTLQRLSRLWRLYHDTGRADAGYQGETKAHVLVGDYAWSDQPFARYFCGYLEAMLRLSGASDVEVEALNVGGPGKTSRWVATWN